MENQIVKHGNITLEIEFVRREDADKATVARVDACEEEFRKMLLDRYYDDRAMCQLGKAVGDAMFESVQNMFSDASKSVREYLTNVNAALPRPEGR